MWKYLFSWPVLAIEAAGLCIITWPWDNHFVSLFWAIITAAVLIGELVNKLWSPKKQTVSNNIQDKRTESPVRFWIMIFIWGMFAATLVGHFCLKGM
jgi:hypothetical protein